MTSLPVPSNENQRLRELASFDILDTPPECGLDDLTELIAQVCETPIALISISDRDRQWFKSRVGLSASEISRHGAFCAHAILGTDLLQVTDAREDPRFVDNPLVTGPAGIRFYAGAPLHTSRGFALGTLCVLDRRPRSTSTRTACCCRLRMMAAA